MKAKLAAVARALTKPEARKAELVLLRLALVAAGADGFVKALDALT